MSNNSTATDLPVADTPELSEAQLAAFRLDPHLINLMWDEPFYSHILRGVTKVESNSISTAGVLAKEGTLTMWWNRRFLASLESRQVKGLLKHECLHLILEHTTTRRHTPHIIWNYATDLAINSLIPEDELPEGGLIPGKPFKALTEEQTVKMGPEAVARYELVSAKIASFPKEMTSEWYFGQLMADEDVKDAIEEGQKGQPGEGGEPGDGTPGLPGPMDDHDGWDSLSEEERELVKGKVRQALEDAVKKCDNSGQWGSVSAGMRGTLRDMISREIDWKAVLRNFCGMTRRANRVSSIKRLNRKYPGIHPGSQRGYTASLAIYIDQSGSVDDESLSLLFGELSNLARRVAFTVYFFDTSVDEENKFEWKKGQRVTAQRTRCGGTCFRCVTEHANKNKDKFDGYLILTDGEASDPGPSRLRRGWVIIPGREMLFDLPRGDVRISMKREAKSEAA